MCNKRFEKMIASLEILNEKINEGEVRNDVFYINKDLFFGLKIT